MSKFKNDPGNPKNVLGFFKVVKKTFKLKKNLTGLLIISVPGIRPFKTNYIRNCYKKIFTNKEQRNFEFITLDYNVPNSISTKTLSILYNSAKVHLNVHPKEKHGRAQAYALANGMPIVGLNNLSYLVKEKFRKEPYYFISDNLIKLPKLLVKSIDYVDKRYDPKKFRLLSKLFLSNHSYKILKRKLIKNFNLDNKDWLFKDDWDLRLAKHHFGFNSSNTYFKKLPLFLNEINSKDFKILDEVEDNIDYTNNYNLIVITLINLKFIFKRLLIENRFINKLIRKIKNIHL